MNKQSNPTANGACNWENRVPAPWSKAPQPSIRPNAPTGLRFHQAKMREAGVQAKAV